MRDPDSSSDIAPAHASSPPSGRLAPRFAQEVLRGLAQVDFMPTALCGAFFAAALFASGWPYGLYGLCGCAVSTATAYALRVDRSRISAGLEGFNGCLVAVGFAVLLGWQYWSTALLALVGCIGATVVAAGLTNLLAVANLPSLTMPFCVVTTGMVMGAPQFVRAWHSSAAPALPTAASGPVAFTWDQLWHAFFANVAQIFLMPQWYVGLLFLIGIFTASWWAGVMACVGSAVGVAIGWLAGAQPSLVAQGLIGYNSVLVAIALCGVFLTVSRWSFAYAVFGAGSSVVGSLALTAFFAPSGGHSLTWPFVLTTLLFVAAAPTFPRLSRVVPPTP